MMGSAFGPWGNGSEGGSPGEEAEASFPHSLRVYSGALFPVARLSDPPPLGDRGEGVPGIGTGQRVPCSNAIKRMSPDVPPPSSGSALVPGAPWRGCGRGRR